MDAPTRTMTTNARICTIVVVLANAGPIHAVSSGCARSARPPATGSTVASDSLVPCTNTSQAFRALAGVAVDDDRKERLAQLIREPQRELAQALRRRPQGHRGRAEPGADDEHVGRVVHLVGRVQHQHEDAEPADLAEPFAERKSRHRIARPGNTR